MSWSFTESCSSCGVSIPSGQSRLCSVCYGDPEWGRDNYLRARMEQQREEAERQSRESDEAAEQARLEQSYDPGVD